MTLAWNFFRYLDMEVTDFADQKIAKLVIDTPNHSASKLKLKTMEEEKSQRERHHIPTQVYCYILYHKQSSWS